MQGCLNSDIKVCGVLYHIQTEDWGREQGFLVSHIFKTGVLVKKIKTSYSEVLPEGAQHQEHLIKLAAKWQHEAILGLLQQKKASVDIYS